MCVSGRERERGGGGGNSKEGRMNRTFPSLRFEYLQYTPVQVIKYWSWRRSVIKAEKERLREVGREERRRRDRKG